jgi:transcription elongation factor Elf1
MDTELATVKELWLIVECPHCHRPQVVPKYVGKGQVYDLDKREEQRCGICGKMFGVVLEARREPED